MRFIIIPYKMGSKACKALKDKLIELGHRALQVRSNSATFRSKRDDRFIYYGKTTHFFDTNHVSYNKHTELASNKIRTLEACTNEGLSTVPWTLEREIASEWLTQNKTVVARATLSGHSGIGITIHANTETPLPNVPLYTQYVKKTFECRIHVFKGRVIDAQIKRKVRNAEENDPYIRNIHTGWVYCREGFTVDDRASTLAITACQAVGVDFGAVDLIYNQHYNQYYILEVNTAPGLEGTTLTNYANAFIGDITND